MQIMALSLFLFAFTFVTLKISLTNLIEHENIQNNRKILGYLVMFILSAVTFVISGVVFFYSFLLNHI